ncbi:MAG: type IX secretion system membrane protein PorP/SprF [Bacteroidia bacterium]|nr:type IX secretion system membrane protein PorP/SprF [Bacteroidia bacterium]HQU99661.1 type IX secretion system membrane protein PorP/SprF [Bacteroidia bacterium]
MKQFIFLLILFLACTQIQAQQAPVYSQYMFNPLIINPAYAGSKPYMSATLLTRKQWLNFKGSPFTSSATIHTPLKNKRMGLGLSVSNDQVGITNQTDLYGSYAYKLPIKEGNLSFGISGGVSFYKSNLSNLTVWDANDVVYEVNVLTNQLPNFGAGLFYSTDKWYAGFSVPQLLSYSWRNGIHDGTNAVHRPVQHYFLTGGYAFEKSEDLVLKPSVLFRYVQNAELQFDLNLNVLINKIIWVGASYRYKDAMVAIFEYQLSRKLRLGYAYDYPLSKINSISVGSHEIMVGFDFGYDIMKVRNPRYF